MNIDCSTIYDVCKRVEADIREDSNARTLSKAFLMSYLVQNQNLKNFVDIGVYKGRNLFSVAFSIYKNGGKSYGIDTYNLAPDVIATNDPEKLYRDVMMYKEECGYGDSIRIIRTAPVDALALLKEKGTLADFVFVDGSRNTKFEDVGYESYFGILQDGSFFAFDGLGMPGVDRIYEQAKQDCAEVFRCGSFGILLKEKPSIKRDIRTEKLTKRLSEIYDKLNKKSAKEADAGQDVPTIAVGVMTYNHEEFINQCLESVVAQTGNFRLHVIICDDCSTDKTDEKVASFIEKTGENEKLKFTYVRNESNIGLIRNLKQLIGLFSGSDYFTFCEGDDYYFSVKRIEEHLKLLQNNPQYIMSFNKIIIYNQEKEIYETYNPVMPDWINTEDLASFNSIGNFSCCFYDSRALQYIKDDLFNMFTVDWMFNIYVSEYGDIGVIKEPISIYRKHEKGAWSSKTIMEQRKEIVALMDRYNKYLNFTYDAYFYKCRDLTVSDDQGNVCEASDLIVIDDAFPHPLSGFRYQENISILEKIPNSRVYTTGEGVRFMGDESVEDLLVGFKREHPHLGAAVQKIKLDLPADSKILYCDFLGNVCRHFVEYAEFIKSPFVFTLYSDGVPADNSESTVEELKSAFCSPYFKKVIVTQGRTYAYLLQHGLCTKEDIKMIPGTANPAAAIPDVNNKKHYGFDKKVLDICFVEPECGGRDEDWKLFIETARLLSEKHDNIVFHAVGYWDETMTNTSGVSDIRFYGLQDQDWMDRFYTDMDAVLSFAGEEDAEVFLHGYLLDNLTAAASHKAALFCADVLHKVDDIFAEEGEIAIVPRDSAEIAQSIEAYYQNPQLLKELCESGYAKIKDLYSPEKQIACRIEFLKSAIDEPFAPIDRSAAVEPVLEEPAAETESHKRAEKPAPHLRIAEFDRDIADSTIFDMCKRIDRDIPIDPEGQSSLPKIFLMSYLAQDQKLESFIEVGLNQGRSLFSVACAIYKNGGKSCGVDPYSNDYASRNCAKEEKRESYQETDFEKLYSDVLAYKDACGYGESMRILRMEPADALQVLKKNGFHADMVHISALCNEEHAKTVYGGYRGILADGGFLVFDGIADESVKAIYDQAKAECAAVFECETFGILLNEEPSVQRDRKIEKLSKMLYEIYGKTEEMQRDASNDPEHLPTVAVGILTYNHVNYIEQCLKSVTAQEGNFKLHVIICDDCSTDGTSDKVAAFIQKTGEDDQLRFTYIRNETNIGLVSNLKQLIGQFKGSDYFTFCEGDDYYFSGQRIEKHLRLLHHNPQYSMSFNSLLMYWQAEDRFEAFNTGLHQKCITTEELIHYNVIANFSSCFYDSRSLRYIQDSIYDMFFADWLFNIVVSQYGDVGYIDEQLTIYRKHTESVWSEDTDKTNFKVVQLIDQYNKYLGFLYDGCFDYRRNLCLLNQNGDTWEKQDAVIIDKDFPDPQYASKYDAYTHILDQIPGAKVFVTEDAEGNRSLVSDYISEYKRNHPEFGAKLQRLEGVPQIKAKLLFCDSPENAFENASHNAKQSGLPFVFVLKNREMLDSDESKSKLKELMLSPCFFKVFVTQKELRGLLLENGFCNERNIEQIDDSIQSITGALKNTIQKMDFDQKCIQFLISYLIENQKLDSSKNVEEIKNSLQYACAHPEEVHKKYDLCYIDREYDPSGDLETCYGLLGEPSYIVFNDTGLRSVSEKYEEALLQCEVLFKEENFAILLKQKPSTKRALKIEKLTKKLDFIVHNFVLAEQKKLSGENEKPVVSVGILAYNQAPYIEECLHSVFSQTGNFKLNVFICDDCSTDGTSEKIAALVSHIENNDSVTVKHFRNETNMGVMFNLNKLVHLIQDSRCDLFTFCEGDDYYLSDFRIERHLNLHKDNPQFVMTYNRLLIKWQEKSSFELFEPASRNPVLTTEELVEDNAIGNLNCSFINGNVLQYIKEDLFVGDMFTGDWMLHIFISQFGDVGLLNYPLNVYRKQEAGFWIGQEENRKRTFLLEQIDQYNRYLNFTYDEYFYQLRTACAINTDGKNNENIDLAIIDDVFPHPVSGFRYQEYSSILDEIPNARIIATGESVHCIDDVTIEELMVDFKRKNPHMGAMVQKFRPDYPIEAKVLYCDFLANAYYRVMPYAEQNKIPFIFTLYPGGRMALNTDSGDEMLRRVLGSPYFKKVIVTQKTTYDYIVSKGFCEKKDIAFIFGVVIPLEKLTLVLPNKKHYGIDKDTLDICFVAHKYTERGEDKGYDIFIETAKLLSAKHDNIVFHVVGPWDEKVIDTAGITDIRFYGMQEQDWFDEFYEDKDIILSPNVNGRVIEGSFDGFPTACVTDAALRNVAMFCTDPLGMNDGFFAEGSEIVIMKHDAQDIAQKIDYYYNNPKALAELCENGRAKVRDLYSYEKQIAPRIELLKNAINEPFEERMPKTEENAETIALAAAGTGRFKRTVKKVVPWKVRKIYHKMNRIMQFIKRI